MKMRPRYSVIASAVSLGFVLSKSVMALGQSQILDH